MTPEVLAAVMGNTLSLERYTQLAPAMTKALTQASCTTVERAAMFCAQLGTESGGLRWVEELASGDAYEGRRDLGNIYPGDGRKYKGHGFIQVTGRHNHEALSKWAFSQGLTSSPTVFVDNPSLLTQDEWAFTSAVWYWTVARPQINALCDKGDIEGVTRAINGGLNGFDDRKARYHKALGFGGRLLEATTPQTNQVEEEPVETVLEYSRDQVTQDTYYNCGPASTQTVVRAATGRLLSEKTLGNQLGTTTNGTNWIGLFPPVLNQHIPGADYKHVEMPNDPPNKQQVEALWQNVKHSIDAGFGVVANIVAPPSNYPRGVYGSVSPAYRGGTIYHYIAVMGYKDGVEGKAVWVADSGFSPYGYWLSLAQLSTLIPPKGYAYATATPKPQPRTEPKEQINPMQRIKSLINGGKQFTVGVLLALIDRATWETRVMVKELCKAQGLDPDKLVADAIMEDNKQ